MRKNMKTLRTTNPLSRTKPLVEAAFKKLQNKEIEKLTANEENAVQEIIGLLSRGHLRVCSKESGQWVTHAWLKQTILVYFRIRQSEVLTSGDFTFYDKIPVKTWGHDEEVRVVPQAIVREGAFVGRGAILMPSFINIGAFVDSGTMVDTWATVGSCAQIGKNVHLSGGVGIGGVLEPPQAQPVIIEDHAFIGSRAVIVEGLLIEEGAVIGAGTVLTQSTKIIDVTQREPVVHRGRVPARSVVIPGTVGKQFPGGTFGTPCALIIGTRSLQTDNKTSLNQALRDYEVPV